jgi:hypothetical protein
MVNHVRSGISKEINKAVKSHLKYAAQVMGTFSEKMFYKLPGGLYQMQRKVRQVEQQRHSPEGKQEQLHCLKEVKVDLCS